MAKERHNRYQPQYRRRMAHLIDIMAEKAWQVRNDRSGLTWAEKCLPHCPHEVFFAQSLCHGMSRRTTANHCVVTLCRTISGSGSGDASTTLRRHGRGVVIHRSMGWVFVCSSHDGGSFSSRCAPGDPRGGLRQVCREVPQPHGQRSFHCQSPGTASHASLECTQEALK